MKGWVEYSAIVTNDSAQEFLREVKRWYDEYQNAGKIVEIQYQMQIAYDGTVVYSAFILARKA